MPHPIEPSESAPYAIRRLARGGLAQALDRLNDGDVPLHEQIHETRKAIKKVRALTHLVRPAVERAKKENRKLRSIAHTLSAVRDAHVQHRTFENLRRGYAGAKDACVQKLALLLFESLDQTTQDFVAGKGTKHLRRSLHKARRRVERWLPAKDSWSALGPGFIRGYDGAQSAMTIAYERKSDVAFHGWRRAVKTHRHQVHALVDLFHEDFRARLEQLDILDELLGDEHDLSALKETLTRMKSRVRWNQRCAGLLKMLNERRARLRSQAHELGQRLFARNVETLRKQVKARLKKAL